MGKALSQTQIDQYHEQGFISPIDVMSEEEALEYAQRLATAELEYPEALNAENRNKPDFVELKRPAGDMDPNGACERDKANQNWAEILYQGASQKRAY
jgi:hypothetical protein